MVDTDAFHGSYAKSPFNFKHNSLQEAKITAGGHSYPNLAIKSDFASNRYMELFNNLFDVMNIGDDNKGNGISREKFANGSAVLAFDLSQDCDDSNHWELIKQGTTTLNFEFASAIPESGVEAIVYAEYDNMLSIDRNRQPAYDFAF
jgi:ribonucleoside-diphosphate reductase beta chain